MGRRQAHPDLRLDSLDGLTSLFPPGGGELPASALAVRGQKQNPPIRTVRVADSDRLVELFTDLAHPATAGQIRRRVARLLEDDTYRMWVAENDEGGLDGFAAGHIVFPIEDDAPAAQLIALVTSERARGTGLGGGLCAAFEQWARSRGAHRAVVNSGADRHSSHEFYRHLGWEQTGARFGKRLTDRD